LSCHILSYLALPFLPYLSCLVLSCLALSCVVLSCRVLSCLVSAWFGLVCLGLAWLEVVLSCLVAVLSCLVSIDLNCVCLVLSCSIHAFLSCFVLWLSCGVKSFFLFSFFSFFPVVLSCHAFRGLAVVLRWSCGGLFFLFRLLLSWWSYLAMFSSLWRLV
jgi:hypothetical protein